VCKQQEARLVIACKEYYDGNTSIKLTEKAWQKREKLYDALQAAKDSKSQIRQAKRKPILGGMNDSIS